MIEEVLGFGSLQIHVEHFLQKTAEQISDTENRRIA